MGAGAAAIGAALTGARLTGARLTGARLTGAAVAGAIGFSRLESSTSAISVGPAGFGESDGDTQVSVPSAAHTPAANSEMKIADARRLGDGRLIRIALNTPLKRGAIPTIAPPAPRGL